MVKLKKKKNIMKYVITIIGMIYLIAYWLLLVFKIGNPTIELEAEKEALVLFIGVIATVMAYGWIRIVHFTK